MVRMLSGVALWTGASLGVWLLTLSSYSLSELIVGSACALLVGVVAAAAQRAVGVHWAPTAASLRPLAALPVAIASDAVQVLTLPLRRRVRGRFATVDIGARGRSPRAATRRAIATVGTTVTPASIVVDVDEQGEMTLHALPTRRPHMEEGFAKR